MDPTSLVAIRRSAALALLLTARAVARCPCDGWTLDSEYPGLPYTRAGCPVDGDRIAVHRYRSFTPNGSPATGTVEVHALLADRTGLAAVGHRAVLRLPGDRAHRRWRGDERRAVRGPLTARCRVHAVLRGSDRRRTARSDPRDTNFLGPRCALGCT